MVSEFTRSPEEIKKHHLFIQALAYNGSLIKVYDSLCSGDRPKDFHGEFKWIEYIRVELHYVCNINKTLYKDLHLAQLCVPYFLDGRNPTTGDPVLYVNS